MKKSIYICVDIAVAAIISVLNFVYADMTGFCVWAYIFLMISVFAQILPVFISDKMRDIANKAVLYTASAIYLVVQLALSLMGYAGMIENGVIVSGVILLLIYAVAVSSIAVMLKSGEKRKSKERSDTMFMDKLILELNVLKQNTKDYKTVAYIDEVIEAVRYGILSSCPEAKTTEIEILDATANLKKLLSTGRIIEIKNECDNLKSLLEKRNMICKLYKGDN